MRSRIAALQSERPALIAALAEAAWKTRLLESSYSGTAAEMFEKGELLIEAQKEVGRAEFRIQQAKEAFASCDQEYGERLGEITQPYHDARDRYGRLNDDLQQLERERDRLAESIPLLRESAAKIEEQLGEREDDARSSRLTRLRSDLERRQRDVIESEQRLSRIESIELRDLKPQVESSRKELERRRENLDRLKSERNTALRAMKLGIDSARSLLRDRERDVQAVRDEFNPLLYQLGEELNGRRILNDSLRVHYARLDEQMETIRALRAALGHAESDRNSIDRVAICFFWFFSAGAFILLATAIVLVATIVF